MLAIAVDVLFACIVAFAAIYGLVFAFDLIFLPQDDRRFTFENVLEKIKKLDREEK